MSRPFAVRRRGCTRKVRFQSSIKIITLAKATDENDARHDTALGAQPFDLALNQVTYFFDYGLEDVFNLFGAHDHEPRVETRFFIIRKSGEAAHRQYNSQMLSVIVVRDLRDINFLVLVLIKVAFNKLLEIL